MTDLNEFMDKPCVYLYHLKENYYKFGVSGEIVDRQVAHEHEFGKFGCVIKLIKLWNCASMKIMKDTEKKIKIFAAQNNILTAKYNQKEIIRTDDIDVVIAKIDKYVAEQNSVDTMEIRKLELEIERERIKLESKRLDFEIMKFKAQFAQSLQDNVADVVDIVNVIDDIDIVDSNNVDEALSDQPAQDIIVENDEIGEFLVDETQPNVGGYLMSSELYRKYCDWCRYHNNRPRGLKTFSHDMEKKYVKERRKIGCVFVGLVFKKANDVID